MELQYNRRNEVDMYDLYNLMHKYNSEQTNTRIVSEFILSDATMVEIFYIGKYKDEIIEGYIEFNTNRGAVVFSMYNCDASNSDWCRLFEAELLKMQIDVDNTCLEEFIDFIKILNDERLTELFYYAEYFKKVFPLPTTQATIK